MWVPIQALTDLTTMILHWRRSVPSWKGVSRHRYLDLCLNACSFGLLNPVVRVEE